MKICLAFATLAAAAGLAGCGKSEPPAPAGGSAPAATTTPAATPPAGGGAGVTGAGASFPAPLYAKWAADYNKASGVRINYQSVGSGAGVKQIEARTIDFGASDMPLKDEELAQKGLVQFPTVIGGVVPVVNIQGVGPGQLRLNGQLLGDIYLGKIKKWNDPAIAALNPGVKLPDAAIAPVRRADGSGTSFIFTNYLSKVNAEWKSKVGEGTAVNWPTGSGGKGNEGVAAFVGRLPGAIGYVEYAYVKQNKMSYALLQNAAGQFVAPEDKAFQAAAAGADWSKSFYQILTDQPGAQAWPITGATFILMHKSQDKPGQAAAALKFFDWAYKNGDPTADDLDYVPMPAAVKQQVDKLWSAQIKDASGNAVAYK
ncbi:MAG TPA: phosphate ABC transporter substrate-binding protein PstS [Ramlibacter sp.]|uniref:phosphate ABC transporter substrate-binding protein PstS n=1 Tax=Ramlibacter sp. TaxID=1917967 RepID=UPI002ED4F3D6